MGRFWLNCLIFRIKIKDYVLMAKKLFDVFGEFGRAAFDLCNRKRDTLYYSALTFGTAAAALKQGWTPDAAVMAVALGTGVRELGRSACWAELKHGFREAAAAMSTAGTALTLFSVAPLAASVFNPVPLAALSWGVGAVMGIGISAYNNVMYRLDARQIVALYRDKLWDYPDKRDPPPPPRRNPAHAASASPH